MFERLFTDHPRSVGESYLAHARTAAGFGGAMVIGGLACLIHGIVPALFTRTGSDTVRRLHERMQRRRPAEAVQPTPDQPWALVYEI